MFMRSPLLLTMFSGLVFAACASSSSDNGDGTRCGNQIVEAGEDCDDGNSTPNDGCNARCETEEITQAVCGDGVVAQTEGCDDGAMADDDGCSASCSVEPGY